MFTNEVQVIIDRAKDIASSLGASELTLEAIAASVVQDSGAARLLAEALHVDESKLAQRFPTPAELTRCRGKLTVSTDAREMLSVAKALVERSPLAEHPTFIGPAHLVCALARAVMRGDAHGIDAREEERLLGLLDRSVEQAAEPARLGDLTRRLRALRNELLARVYGQDNAVHQFIEGLFSTEVVAAVDKERRQPSGLFVFAGPPGVGKTFLAELGASYLDRPIRRFDMSAYAHSHEASRLIGTPPIFQGAEPGMLTGFVQQNPNAVLLFDEIEKAHPSAILFFLQLLDAGRLEDKFTEQDVDFRNTILIFTTNVGRSLYENENSAGVHAANAAFHRSTVLDALRNERDPRTGEPFFPAPICSRLATGYPVLFDHLRVDDLARIAEVELRRVAALLERQTRQTYEISEELPLALVLREGARADARTVKARAEAFLKEEVFKACQLFADEHIDSAMDDIRKVAVELDQQHAGAVAEQIFKPSVRPSVLFVGPKHLGRMYAETISSVDWSVASSADQAFDVLTRQSVDFVLLDLSLQPPPEVTPGVPVGDFHDLSSLRTADTSVLPFDHVPLAARKYALGQQLLEHLHRRLPEIPVFLFSLAVQDDSAQDVDDELLLACVRAGGARGALRTALAARNQRDFDRKRDSFREDIERIATRLRRERIAAELAAQSQVVIFDTAPQLANRNSSLTVRCRNFRLIRAVHSADATALVSDIDRPTTCFDDVIGASAAKDALRFLHDWLREPKKYAAAGVETPRGVLLTGPPGTGKTMLARALAGESDCAFLVEAGTNFVTKYAGSGPENVRSLFARARRYAPAIVFIDEIDAIGANRGEARAGFVGHSEALTLEQLLTEMDGFSKTTSRPVIVIAATNYPEKLDPALRRRFSRVIEVELPTRDERELYLRTRLEAKTKHAVTDDMLRRIAVQTAGKSIADLEGILAEAAVMALRNEGLINDDVLSEAFETVTMGEVKGGGDLQRTARHEAGHALLMCLTGEPPIFVSIVGRGNLGGYAAFDVSEERRAHTRVDLENQICQCLGGREAERLYYDDGLGESTGPANDLEQATCIAEAMVKQFGMADEIGFVRIHDERVLLGTVGERAHAAVRRIIEEQGERARALLEKHRDSLDRIAHELLERNRLLQAELIDLLPEELRKSFGQFRV